MKIDKDVVGIIVATVVCIVVMISLWVGWSYFEAHAYNNITGKQVSTFDAMFVQLRVQESASD